MEFKDRLRQLREGKNITQKKCAEDLDVEYANYNKWENGKVPNLDTICTIAEYFKVSTDYLLGRSDARKPENEKLISDFGLTEESISVIEMLKDKCPTLDTSPNDKRTLADVFSAFIPIGYRTKFFHWLKMVSDPVRGKDDLPNWDEQDKAFMERNADPDNPEVFNPNISDHEVFMIHLHNALDSIVQEMRGEISTQRRKMTEEELSQLYPKDKRMQVSGPDGKPEWV